MTFEQVQERIRKAVIKEMDLAGRARFIFLPKEPTYDVVWSGGELLPDRPQTEDDRLRYVPSYDLDDGEAAPRAHRRKYTLTGNHTREKRESRLVESPSQELGNP